VVPAEQDRPDIARKRRRWKAHQHRVDPRRLVFLDETWVKTNMAPLRGWGPSGKRLAASVPYGHWMTMTFIAALRHDRVEAPCVFDGPINGMLFTAYVEQFLAPTLAPGDIVVLDNLGSHKGKAARAAIRKVGAHLLFLPPYSPDLNPSTALCQAQAPDAQSPGANPSRNLASPWQLARSGLLNRVRQLPRQFRLCCRLNTTCSRDKRPFTNGCKRRCLLLPGTE
jgi:hypothetical protein